jgi:hypothetical protein
MNFKSYLWWIYVFFGVLNAQQFGLVYPPTSICCKKTTPINISPTKYNLDDDSIIFKIDSSTALPNYISLDPNTGVIASSATSTLTARTRKPLIINAFKNDELIASSSLSLEVILLALPKITYAKTDWKFTRNSPLAEKPTPTKTGGAITEWSISPDLPAGLTFKEGIISGTPTSALDKTSFTVTAKNRAGSSTAVLSITVHDIAPVIAYSKENWIFVKDFSVSEKPTPTNTGGKPDSWSITPTLPQGLIFNNGIISGTPTTTSQLTDYTVTAKNVTGSSSATLSITINVAAPQITYTKSDWIFTRNLAISDEPKATNSGGTIESWSISPSLPAGLSFKEGVISGTPTSALTKTSFTISATNKTGTSSATLSITVNDIIPKFDVIREDYVLSLTDATNLKIPPSQASGAIDSWIIEPSLPAGLTFKDGEIFGTPTAAFEKKIFKITAKNSAGSAFTWRGLSTNAPTPIATNTGTSGSGGTSPSAGGTGTSGTGTSGTGTTSGSTSSPAYAIITPNISYSKTDWTFSKGYSVLDKPKAINSGGAVDSWTIEPALPAGLTFKDGEIFGTPTTAFLKTDYTITAKNILGFSSAKISISTSEVPVGIVKVANGYKITPDYLLPVNSNFGYVLDISGDGKTIINVASGSGDPKASAWNFIKNEDGSWSQQGPKLVANDFEYITSTRCQFYEMSPSVAISRDGNTAAVGRPSDNDNLGAVWIYVRKDGVWSQQGSKLVGAGYQKIEKPGTNCSYVKQGTSVDISADGNTVIFGAPEDNQNQGAAWIFTRSNNEWTQQGEKLVIRKDPDDPWESSISFGQSVALTPDGNKAVISGPSSGYGSGYIWVFNRNEATWTKEGKRISGVSSSEKNPNNGRLVNISDDGETTLTSSFGRTNGAVLVYKKNQENVWSFSKLLQVREGSTVNQGPHALSSDGNTILMGVPGYNSNYGALFPFKFVNEEWIQQEKIVPEGGVRAKNSYLFIGGVIRLTDDNKTAVVSGVADNEYRGAIWVVDVP